jgi:EAL domain-containing protein (putative c-di-GMP-specific phosphodiesterase class I)
VAEETGLIVSIGKWVLYEACRQIKEWQKQISMDPPLTISVNFSAIQLMQPDLIEQIKKVLQDTNLDPGSLNLEITESVIINDINTAQSVLNQIRNLGVGIHIDDFGTGYSSLSYLYQLPFDAVKVDRSFINQFNDNNKKRELVKSIISMTHGLGMKVIAEGIESIEQAAQLRELECDVGQGYYFYKPMDSKAAENLLREYLDIATQFQTNPQ